MLTPSLPTEAATGLPLSARRRIQSGLVVTSATGVPRTGILSAATPLLVTGTTDPTMTYRIAPFVGASSRDGVGVEFVANDASDTAQSAIAPSANSRIDVIWFRSRFPSLTDSAGENSPVFGVTRGTPDANPQKPTNLPPGAEELATAVVTSSDLTTQTVVITNSFRWTVLVGGIVPLRSKAEMDAWTPANGSVAWRIDEGTEYVRAGGVWTPIGGVMPRISLVPSVTQTVNNDFGVSNWAPPGASGSDQALGTDWFEYVNANGIGSIRVKRAGRYRVCVRMAVQNANDQAIAAYLIANGDKNAPLTQDTVRTHPTYGTMLKLDVPSIALAAGATLALYIPAVSAALAIGGPGRAAGQFDVQYLGPIS